MFTVLLKRTLRYVYCFIEYDITLCLLFYWIGHNVMFTVFEYNAWYIDTMYVMFTFTNTTYVMFIIFLCAICYIYCFSNTIELCNVNTWQDSYRN